MNNLFKTQIQADLKKVFLNENEFADLHNINGVDGIACVIDGGITESLRPGLGRFDGSEKETITLAVAESDWLGDPVTRVSWQEKPPVYNQLVTIDSVRYRIKSVNSNNGLYEISMESIK